KPSQIASGGDERSLLSAKISGRCGKCEPKIVETVVGRRPRDRMAARQGSAGRVDESCGLTNCVVEIRQQEDRWFVLEIDEPGSNGGHVRQKLSACQGVQDTLQFGAAGNHPVSGILRPLACLVIGHSDSNATG